MCWNNEKKMICITCQTEMRFVTSLQNGNYHICPNCNKVEIGYDNCADIIAGKPQYSR